MKLKRISDILARLIDVTMVNTSTINDFTIGSTIRSIYEAVSMEIEQLYMLTNENITWGIEEGVLEAFDFSRRQAKKAYGNLTITFSTTTTSEVVISAGTSFESGLSAYMGVATFETLKNYVVAPGSTYATVEVYCTNSGTIGNFPKNTITRMLNSMANIKSITNEQDFLTGSDEETLAAVQKRFRDFVETRSRGTLKAIDYGTRLVEDITGVYVYEQTGLITVYCHDNNGNLSDDLKAQVETSLETYRPAGVKMVVSPVSRISFDLEVTAFTDSEHLTSSFNTEVVLGVTNFLNTKTVGQNYVEAEITRLVMNMGDTSVTNVTALVTSPSDRAVVDGEILIAPSELIRAGNISVTLKESVA